MLRSPRNPLHAFWAPLLLIGARASLADSAARSPDAIVREMNVAQRELKAAIGDAHNMADPANRPAIAAKAMPPLRRMLADERELAAAAGRPVPTFFEVQLRAIGVALGDDPSIDALTTLATDPLLSLRGQGGQLLARWLLCPGNAMAQGKVIDDLAILDRANPNSDDLARFTAMMRGSAATPALRSRLDDLLGPMNSPAANGVRQRAPTTRP